MKIFWFGIAFIERIDKKIQAVYFCKTGFYENLKPIPSKLSLFKLAMKSKWEAVYVTEKS
jgi:hypothetical protein